MRRSLLPLVVTSLLVTGAAAAQAQGPLHPVVAFATRSDTTAPLRALPPIPPRPEVLGQIFETRPAKLLPHREGSAGPSGPDPVLQSAAPEAYAPALEGSFEGINNVNGVLPPDTNGDVGPNHYVQIVNLSFAIWDKFGAKLYGPVDTNTLWQGFGGPCETTNDGDPIALYDHLAGRWLMSQFALPRFPRGPFYQCVAVSQTGDPLGSWHRYEFTISSSKLNDYPKFGVWPDGYYMSINQFKCSMLFCNWAGQGVVAFERDQMLNGGQARMVYFDLYNLDPNLGGMLPSDLEGPAPPSGAPNLFAQVDDNAWGYSPDQLQLWEFHVNWANPSASTFTHAASLGTAAFDSNMCGYSRNCIPQPGGTNVDAISDRLMYRLQYRDFGDHQTLVVNHTVDANASDKAGIRWYELRNSGSGWSIHQQGTFSPDSANRWMGSVAMNGVGDIALGYSISSASISPSIRATGRLADDLLGQMTQGELTIVSGSGYQQHSSGRWGDYSSMSVDPGDDCTFWYTQEYYDSIGSAPWQTRIGRFKLRACGLVDNPPTVSITGPADGATVAGEVILMADATDDNGVSQVEFFLDGVSLGMDSDGSDGWSTLWNTTSVTDGGYDVSATATDTIGQTASDSIRVTVDNVNDPPLASFTASCNNLTCDFDGSGSSDPDGSIVAYAWAFGDENTGSGVTVSHTYAADGTYTVTLTVTDDGGSTGSMDQEVNVSQSTATGMHIGDLDGASVNNGSTWTASVTITVHDAGESLVSGATVNGTWSGGLTGTGTCTTDGSGQCSLTISGIRKRDGSVTFTVAGAVHASLTYNAADNHDPDGDSNGTAIAISKP